MKKTTLSVHLMELKRRVLYSLCIFVVFFCFGLFYDDFLYDILTAPLMGGTFSPHVMLMTSLTSGLSLSLRFGFLSGVFLGMPFFIYHIWRYVLPALKQKERGSFRFFFTLFPLLFYIGAIFAYVIITPLAWDFLLSFYQSFQVADLPVQFMPRVDEYLNLMSSFIVTFGLAFELPLVLILLMRLKIISPDFLVEKRRFVIVGIFFLSAVLTPPDVLSQV
ncbi:MAG: twin-arginine translocase subunit TatC, partial [Alphaproteobacteria bacterium]|nr:twin-arginine translocase subunit TatC [Alphaproteobacteria bacterium]